MEKFSYEKAAKFNNKDKFFDINYVWVPGLEWTVKKLYYTRIRPEFIVFLSLVAGLTASIFYSGSNYVMLLLGAFFIELKNFLDTADGYLARAKGLTSRFGRFLDSLSDAAVYFALFTGIGINLASGGDHIFTYFISYAAMLSAFLQCSIYNYYLVSYKTLLQGEGINRTDERFRKDEKKFCGEGLTGFTLFLLQQCYQLVYGWQDRIVEFVDKRLYRIRKPGNSKEADDELFKQWYADKSFLSLVSPLCFGTQILVLVVFTIFNNLEGFLWFIVIAGNSYAMGLLLIKALLGNLSGRK